jgi:TonB family protein
MSIDAVFMARPSIVLLAGLAVMLLLKSQPAALRHWALAAAVGLASAQPLIQWLVPAVPVPSVHWAVESRTTVAFTETAVALDRGATSSARARPIDWPGLITRVWVAGTAVSIGILIAGIGWLSWLGARARPAGPDWIEAEVVVRGRVKLRRAIRVAITPHPALIVTWGFFRPVILLPIDADLWSAERKRLVIAHEMAHLIRHDWLIQLFAEVARAFNWYNPLFWIACARLRRESEYACDDIVLDTGVTGTCYAEHLIGLARESRPHGRTWLPAPSAARPSTLERRVRAMLNPDLNRQPVSRRQQLSVAALLCAIALPLSATSQPSSAPSGRVSDPSGRPLADATLRLAPSNGGETAETRSDANGNFQFAQLPAGEYMLSVRYPGFSASRQRMQLSSGGTTIELQVQIGTLQETITVAGASQFTRVVTEDRNNTAAPACSPSLTGGQLTPPMKVRDVRPRYRQEWLDAGLQGVILMKATIGRDGKVRGVDVISPVNAELEDEAMAAVGQWEFSPTYLNCEPVEVQMYVTVQFKAAQ